MKKFAMLAIAVLSLALCCAGQNVSQSQVNLSFLTGGPYQQSAALDVTFGFQFTANNQLQGDFITMPGANFTGYFGGDSWNLPVCGLLASTALSCGKFQPFATFEGGLGKIDGTSVPSEVGPAGLVEVGANYDASGQGKYGLLAKAGWGHFGPDLPVAGSKSLSGNGFFFYIGANLGGFGVNQAATDAKIARMKQASDKKALKHLKSQCKSGDKGACQLATQKEVKS
jgi:hypothetical protein